MEFILQSKDSACQLITLMNALLYWDGKCDLKYKSAEFLDLLDICGGTHGSIIDIHPAYGYLSLKKGATCKAKTFDGLKKWMIKSQITKLKKLKK